MGPHTTLLFLHVISASIWFGGYVALFFIVLPQAKREKKPEIFIEFERSFQKIGFPALLAQCITGPILAMHFYSNPIDWFKFQTPHQDHIASKIIFLVIIVILVLRTRNNTP
jgi:putative copper export protein